MRMRNRPGRAGIVAAFGAVVALGLAVGCGPKTDDRVLDRARISLDEVRRLTQEAERQPRIVALADSRSVQEYRAGHITGARRLDLTAVPKRGTRDPELESYRQIVVYGNNRGTPSAKAVAKRLMEVGYRNVRWFADGLDAWVRAGYPVTVLEVE